MFIVLTIILYTGLATSTGKYCGKIYLVLCHIIEFIPFIPQLEFLFNYIH